MQISIKTPPVSYEECGKKYFEEYTADEFERSMRTFVYVMTDGEIHKVGISKNPIVRRSGVQRDVGKPVELVKVFSFDYLNAERVEASCHDLLSVHWVFGEWFDAPLDVVVGTVRDFIYSEKYYADWDNAPPFV